MSELRRTYKPNGKFTIENLEVEVADSGNSVSTIITVSENISAGNVVNNDGSKANSATTGKRNKAIGVAGAAIASGFSGTVTTDGILQYGGWAWVAGDILYLNGTALSTISPGTGFSQRIGVAIASDKIDVEIGEALLL